MPRIVNPDMVVLARESRGMTQAELAETICVTQAKVSKYENGILDVSDSDLISIVEKLNYSTEFFYQHDKIYGLGSSMLFNRKLKSVGVAIQKRVQANVNILKMQIERLLRCAEVETRFNFDRLDINEYNEDIVGIAARVRAAWQLPSGPIQNLTNAVESAGGIVVLCNFDAEGIDATHLWLTDLPPLFFMNKNVSPDRYRFSLAHEIGHAVMHQFPTGDIEDEANSFASEFLMPSEQIRDQLVSLTLHEAAVLKPYWKVSMQSLIRRAYDLECISESTYRRLYTKMSAAGYRKVEPIDIPAENPVILSQLLKIHKEQLGYEDADISKLLFTDDFSFTEDNNSEFDRFDANTSFKFEAYQKNV